MDMLIALANVGILMNQPFEVTCPYCDCKMKFDYTQFDFSVDYTQLRLYNVVCRLISSDEDSNTEECPLLCLNSACNEIMYVQLEAKHDS